jgi:hypothetical protein
LTFQFSSEEKAAAAASHLIHQEFPGAMDSICSYSSQSVSWSAFLLGAILASMAIAAAFYGWWTAHEWNVNITAAAEMSDADALRTIFTQASKPRFLHACG